MKWLFLLPGLLFGQSLTDIFDFSKPPGSSSYSMLKLELDARTVAMGGGGAGLPANANASTEVNPASSALDSFKLSANHAYPFSESESQLSSLTYNLPLGSYKLLLHYRYLGYDNIRGFSDTDESEGEYSAHTYKIQTGAAGEFKNIYWGVYFSFVENNVSYAKYFTSLIDVGLQYQIVPGLWAGAAFNNGALWTSSAVNDQNENPFPPAVARAGLAYHYPLLQSLKVVATVDGKTRNDEEFHMPMGLEATYQDMLSLRMGYPVLLEEGSFSFGTGLKWNYFKLDYALKLHETLSAGHFWTLGLQF